VLDLLGKGTILKYLENAYRHSLHGSFGSDRPRFMAMMLASDGYPPGIGMLMRFWPSRDVAQPLGCEMSAMVFAFHLISRPILLQHDTCPCDKEVFQLTFSLR
jgi:hypothetical protein